MNSIVSKPVERKMRKETAVNPKKDRKRRKNKIYKSKESRSTKYVLQINPSILANTVNINRFCWSDRLKQSLATY